MKSPRVQLIGGPRDGERYTPLRPYRPNGECVEATKLHVDLSEHVYRFDASRGVLVYCGVRVMDDATKEPWR